MNELPGHQPQESIKSPERPLAGKVAVGTGFSRDIGAGIAEALAAEGVDILSIHRDPRKGKRADAVSQSIQNKGGRIEFVTGDITQPEGLQALDQKLEEGFGGKLDYLILNASGPDRSVNVDAANNLLDMFLPKMNEGGVVILMQSVPGHFDPQLRGLGKMPSIYDPVAAAKYEGEGSLRQRIGEIEEKKLKFRVVCPPVVPDTSNMNLFDYSAKREAKAAGLTEEQAAELTATKRHEEISDKLGLPRIVPIPDVGAKVVEIIKRDDLPSGYTEFFGDVIDSQTILEQWYGPHEVYVNTFERIDDAEDGRRRGEGYMIVSHEQGDRPSELPCIDRVRMDEDGNYVGLLKVTKEHNREHLKQISIFPGHKQIRSAVEYTRMMMAFMDEKPSHDTFVRLKGFDETSFEFPIIPGEVGKNIEIRNSNFERNGNTIKQDIEITMDDKVTTRIKGMVVELVDEEHDEEKGLRSDQLIEGMAQTLGLITLDKIDNKTMPLFKRIGPTVFHKSRVYTGDGVHYFAVGAQEGKRDLVGASFVKSSTSVDLVTSNGINAVVAPASIFSRTK